MHQLKASRHDIGGVHNLKRSRREEDDDYVISFFIRELVRVHNSNDDAVVYDDSEITCK